MESFGCWTLLCLVPSSFPLAGLLVGAVSLSCCSREGIQKSQTKPGSRKRLRKQTYPGTLQAGEHNATA